MAGILSIPSIVIEMWQTEISMRGMADSSKQGLSPRRNIALVEVLAYFLYLLEELVTTSISRNRFLNHTTDIVKPFSSNYGTRYSIDTVADFIINSLTDPHHPTYCTVTYTGALGTINNVPTIKNLRNLPNYQDRPEDRFRFSEVVFLMTCIITLAISNPGQAGKSTYYHDTPRRVRREKRTGTKPMWPTTRDTLYSTVGQDTAVQMIWQWIYMYQSIPSFFLFTLLYNTAGSTLNGSVYSIPSFNAQAMEIIDKNVDLFKAVPYWKSPEAQKYLDILERGVDAVYMTTLIMIRQGDMSRVQSHWGKDSHTLLKVLCKVFDATWGIPLVLNDSVYMNLSRIKQITAQLHHTFHLPYDKEVYHWVVVDNSRRIKEQEGGKSVFRLACDAVIRVSNSDRCQSPGCSETFTSLGRRFQGCGGCKRVSYCSEVCQRHAWKLPEAPHRMVCSALATFADKLQLPASISLATSAKIVRDEEVDAICLKEGVTKDEAYMIHAHFISLAELLVSAKQNGGRTL
ncbi:uncharacterized protein EV420DRAFT_1482094 [Desarmillaria tabescens]|uniref:MYND-type domain-containing protein n=1 Tax=Armillaria tabescens TaxID=1929756 RepID=A0AA39N0L6_ARMTA|nr:uncharacterized protein EV420DRAFT_1482094 [Desarmillaria tabescens]KAK0452795.1 hypothetical protein EV420DRAFT_1482094 [Desarmillaria tabescens]